MSTLSIGLTLFGAMLVLMALRVPIAAAMFIPGALGYWAIGGETALLNQLKGIAYARFSVYDLSVIPLFLLMGQFATQGGLSRALFRFANAMIGHLKGGMAMAAVLACAAFGAVCGSSVATAATVAQVALPEMNRYGYSGRLSTATLAAGGTLGILIPPSVPLVIYAILTEQNIAKLFAAAFIPGIIAAVGYCISIGVTVHRNPALGPAQPKASWGERGRLLIDIWPVVLIFIIVFGGIYDGWFTPTEGAAVGAVSTFVAALFKGELSIAAFKKSFLVTAETTGMIFMIFIGADMLNSALALSQMPEQLAQFVGGLHIPGLLLVVGVLVFYIILGCVMDELSMLMLTIPVLFPAVMGLDLWGLNPSEKAIWFGILVLMVVEIGLIAPPVGLNVYVINSLARDVPMSETYKGVVPFLVSDAIRVTLLLFFPVISLYLVRAMT
jgi:tripartite ATP-independent transporter DctM subunit